MRYKSKMYLRQTLARILKESKELLDLSNTQSEASLCQRLINLTFEALDEPNLAQLDCLIKKGTFE